MYYPVIDVTITTGNGLSKNPATTVEVLDKLATITVTEDNWKILAAELEYLDIPQKQDIIASWKKKFEPDENELSPEIIDALKTNPELKAALEEIVAQSSMNQAPEIIPGGVPLDIPVSQVQDMPISVPTVSDLPI